jgi:hypothetical protein
MTSEIQYHDTTTSTTDNIVSMVASRKWNDLGGPGGGTWSIWEDMMRECRSAVEEAGAKSRDTHIFDSIDAYPVEALEKE